MEEKAIQLSLMTQIYESAFRVCIWLGEASVGSDIGAKSIQANGYPFPIGWDIRKLEKKYGKLGLPFREVIRNSIAIQNRADLVREQQLGEVKELLDRSWWHRAWVIQEAVVARKLVLMCGEEKMPWENVTKTIGRYKTFASQELVFGIRVFNHH